MKKKTRADDVARERREEARIAELLRWTGTAPDLQTAEPPPGLEARMLQFIDGAAHARTERRQAPWRWLFALVGTAAATAALTAWLVSPAMPKDDPRTAVTRTEGPPAAVHTEAPGASASGVAHHAANAGAAHSSAPPERDPPIVAALRSGQDWRSRLAAAQELSSHKNLDARGVAALSASLKGDPDWRIREVALSALAVHSSDETTRALAVATEDPHLPLRLAATKALVGRLQPASMAARDATDALLRRLERDPDWRVRDCALNLLLASSERARAAALGLTDGHSRLRSQARTALARATR